MWQKLLQFVIVVVKFTKYLYATILELEYILTDRTKRFFFSIILFVHYYT